MFAIAFDLTVASARRYHPKGASRAYLDIERLLAEYHFRRVQGSLYVTDNEDMMNLFIAIKALGLMEWFPKAVRDIRGFRIELWSNFTPAIKANL